MAGYYDQINYGGYGSYGAPQPAFGAAPVGAVSAPAPMVNGTGYAAPQQNNGYSVYGQAPQMQNQMQTPQLTGWQKFGYIMDGIGAIGGLWGAIQQNKIAKRQLALAEESYNTNMNNTIQSYNTALEDRIRARYAMEGRPDQADSYLDEHRLSRSS